MPKITFTTPKDINNYSPELISKVRNVISLGELAELFDEYDRNEVEDARKNQEHKGRYCSNKPKNC